jgi:hypothetical protein
MPRIAFAALAIVLFLPITDGAYAAAPLGDTATPTAKTDSAAPTAKRTKRPHLQKTARWHGYGFLPGYRTPERIEWERWRNRGPVYWYGYPRFYRGRWNGGGFGPCWTQTPIGPHWNCG